MKAPFWNVIARRRDGTTAKEAQAELSTITLFRASPEDQISQSFD
jgi:hypothetical protein